MKLPTYVHKSTFLKKSAALRPKIIYKIDSSTRRASVTAAATTTTTTVATCMAQRQSSHFLKIHVLRIYYSQIPEYKGNAH
jgi:hypothetical protein